MIPYLLTGEEKHLHLREFSEAQKQAMDWYAEAVRVGAVDLPGRRVTFAGVPFYGVGVPDDWKPYVPPLHTEFTDNLAVCCGRFISLTGKAMPETAKRLAIRGNRAIGMSADVCLNMNNE